VQQGVLGLIAGFMFNVRDMADECVFNENMNGKWGVNRE
jgi:hypothetical protein